MASNREERFLMRQRGAGTSRDIRDSGFAIAIPGGSTNDSPLQSSARRASTRSARKDAGTAKKTPASKPAPQFRPRNSLSAAGAIQNSNVAGNPSVKHNLSSPSSGKRRKRKSISQSSLSAKRRRTSQNQSNLVAPSSAKGKAATIVEEQDAEEEEGPEELEPVAELEDIEEEEEQPVAPPLKSSSNPSKRRSIGAKGKQPLRPTQANASRRAVGPPATEGPSSKPSKRKPPRQNLLSVKAQYQDTASDSNEEQPSAEPPDQENPPTKKQPSLPSKRKRRRQPDPDPEPVPSPDSSRKQKRVRISLPDSDAKQRNKPKPKKPRPARHSSPDLTSAARQPTEGDSIPTAGSIPVTVHRLTKSKTLFFMQDFVSASAVGDELAGPAPLAQRPGVNSIDVLSQIVGEICKKYSANLKEQGRKESSRGKRERWRRRREAVDKFWGELEGRFLGMTTQLDHHKGLTQRLKKLQKTKSELLATLLGVREERETLALRADEVRRVHEKESKAQRKTIDLERGLEDIKLAVERGREEAKRRKDDGIEDEDEVGLESRIKGVAERVSGQGGRIGVLERIKRMNAYLERVAEALS